MRYATYAHLSIILLDMACEAACITHSYNRIAYSLSDPDIYIFKFIINFSVIRTHDLFGSFSFRFN